MRFLLCYDIEEDRQRTRLVKILEEYGERIQYSVFEFNITQGLFIEMRHKIKKTGILKKKNISISIYPLCEACYKKIERHGVNRLLDEDNIVF